MTAERQGKRKEKTGEERAMHTFSCKGEEEERERERERALAAGTPVAHDTAYKEGCMQ